MGLFRRHANDVEDRPLLDRTDDVYDRNDALVRREVVHERYGGLDVPASIAGALVALALTAILGAVAGAVFETTVFGTGDVAPSMLASAAVAAGVVLCIAYFVGGWTAGRIARYSGTRNGLFAAFWTLLFGAAVGVAAAVFGSRYDVLSGIGLPNFVNADTAVTGGIVGAVAAIVLMFLSAALGGRRGEAYHTRADDTLVEPHLHPHA